MPQDTIPQVVPNIGSSGRYQAFTPSVDTRPMDKYFNYMQEQGLHTFELVQAIGEKYEENQAKAAFNKFDVELNRFTQENFYSKQNKDLVDAYQPTLNSLYDIAKKYADNLSGIARDTFINSANERMRQTANNMNTQYMRGLVAWGNEESQARIANLANDALADVEDWRNPNSSFAVSHQAIRNELTENLISNGVPPDSEAFHNQYLATLSQFHCGSIDTYINTDRPKDGFAYLNAHKKEMTQADINKYTEKLNKLQDAVNRAYLAQQTARRAEANRLKGMSWVEQYKLAVQEYNQRKAEITASNLSDKDKAKKIAELDTSLALAGDYFNTMNKQSQLNDASIKNQWLKKYQGDIDNYLKGVNAQNGQPQPSIPLDQFFQGRSADLARVEQLGLREQLQSYMNNRGIIVPTDQDYSLYAEMTTYPERFITKTSVELESMMSNFTDKMKARAKKDIENEAKGLTSASKLLLDQFIKDADITDKAQQGRARLYVENRADEILSIKGTKIISDTERKNAFNQAILDLNSMRKEGRLWGSNSALNDYLTNPEDTQGIFLENTATDTVGAVHEYSIPLNWMQSSAGQVAYNKALAEARKVGRKDDQAYINWLVSKTYNEQKNMAEAEARNKQNLGLNE